MRSYVQILLCTVVLTIVGVSSPAAADRWARDDHYDPTRIYGGLWLGFGGDIEVERVGLVGNLGNTIGGQGGVDVVVARHLSLGGEVRLGGFRIGGFDARSTRCWRSECECRLSRAIVCGRRAMFALRPLARAMDGVAPCRS